jgi:hypothetical protein
MTTKQKGDVSEAHVIAALLKRGLNVLMPFGDRNRYDLVVEHRGKFARYQVKTARLSRIALDSICFNTSTNSTENGNPVQRTYHGSIDYFAVYYPQTDSIYVVPVEECALRESTLRLKPSKNGQVARTKKAQDYSLSEHIKKCFSAPLAQ